MIIVQKFGGTSVADVNCLRKVCTHILQEKKRGNKTAVVVSAMAGVTNQLVDYNKSLSLATCGKAQDVVLAAGEQISVGLLALALSEYGAKGKPLLGWQLPILTNGEFGQGKIQNISCQAIHQAWDNDEIPIIAGFQGVDQKNNIITLGRGGSDLTAVALANFLKADRADIYTDIDGVYTADPRIVENARRIPHLGYDAMIAMADGGAKVLQRQAAECAKKYNVKVHICSTFTPGGGTIIDGNHNVMPALLGIAHVLGDARIVISNLKNAANLDENSAYLISKKEQGEYHTLVLGVRKDESSGLQNMFRKLDPDCQINVGDSLAKIAVIGSKINSKHTMSTLLQNEIKAEIVMQQKNSLKLCVDQEQAHQAICALHNGVLNEQIQ